MQQNVEVTAIHWRRVLPWVHLFRAFAIAIGPRKVLLGAVAVLALAVGDMLCERLFVSTGSGNLPRLDAPLGQEFTTLGTFARLARPYLSVLEPGWALFYPETTWVHHPGIWTRLLWGLLVAGLFGGALARIAALQFADAPALGIREALRFSGRRVPSYLGAPLLPLLAIAFFAIVGFVIGWLGRIPWLGEIAVGVFWPLLLFFGFCGAVVLLVVGIGWPLMVAAISVDGVDAFSGLSRAYSYIVDRPWHYLWYALVAAVIGVVVVSLAAFFAWVLIYLAWWYAVAGLGDAQARALAQVHSSVGATPGWSVDGTAAGRMLSPGAVLIRVWLRAVSLLVSGVAYSYFWTASTMIYLLLRLSADGVMLDDIPQFDAQRERLPVVGIPAAERSVQDATTAQPEPPDNARESERSKDTTE